MPCFRELGVPAFACLQMIGFHRQKLDEEQRLQIAAGHCVNGSGPRNRDLTRRSAGLAAVAQDDAACLEAGCDWRDAR